MTEEILKRIDILAAKLEVASGELWRILLLQSKVEFFEAVIFTILFALIAFVCFKISYNFTQKEGYLEDAGAIFVGCTGIVFSILCLINISIAIQAGVNPEYVALKKILEILK